MWNLCGMGCWGYYDDMGGVGGGGLLWRGDGCRSCLGVGSGLGFDYGGGNGGCRGDCWFGDLGDLRRSYVGRGEKR